MTPTHFSLFSGIGGIDLAAEWAGFTTVGQCERDPYCRRVLARHWSDVPRWEDVRDVTALSLRERGIGRPDLLSGGFPCQDVSRAGKRAGIDAPRSGLWREFARCIRDLRPRYVLVENVPGLLKRGMDRVLGDLAARGYDAQWQSLPAAALGAPHIRERVFIVAHAHGQRRPPPVRLQARPQRAGLRGQPLLRDPASPPRTHWDADQPRVAGVADGLPGRLHRSLRVAQSRALGNAVIPQQVYPFLVAVMEAIRVLSAEC